jgi:hypothetical protein
MAKRRVTAVTAPGGAANNDRAATASGKLSDLGIAALGVALIAAGAVAVFVVDNGTGAAALLSAGVVLLAIVFLGDRLETLRWGGLELTLRRQADAAAAAGDHELEQQLRAAADTLAQRAAPIASSYEAVRRSMRSGTARTAAMEADVARAREDAQSDDFTSTGEDLAELFRRGSDGERVYALAAMQVRPELATAEIVLEAIRAPRSPFEHYHSLLVADRIEPRLTPAERAALAAAIREQLNSQRLRRDSDRVSVAGRILERLDDATGR